ncbi:MAG TPA: S9 family peptidase [Longimicrobiales bacterium]
MQTTSNDPRRRRAILRVARTMHRAAGAAAVAALLAAAPRTGAAQAPAPRTLEVDDLFRIARVGSPQVSPDGRWVAYTVTRTILEEEKSETSIWRVPTAGGEAVRMSGEGYSASSPRWSPDGKYLSFLAAKGGEAAKTQVWAFPLDGGDARPLTDVKQGVSDYAWSPDGRRLALVIRDPRPGEGEEGKDGKKVPPPYVIDRLQFKRDYTGYLDRRRTHIYVYDVATKALRQLTSGDWDDSDPVWSPDGKRIAFVSNRTEEPDANSNTDIWVVAADGGDGAVRRVTTNPGADAEPAWSPDGRWIAHVTVVEPELIWYATNHLAVVPAEGGEARVLTRELDRNVSAPRFTEDGRSITFLLEDSGSRHLARVAATGGEVERPIAGDREVSAWHGAAGVTVATISEPHLPGELFVLERGRLRRLTSTNDSLLSVLRLAEVENIHFRSADGTEIEGWLFYPVGYRSGERYPTLLRIHGGPVSQYDWGFQFEAQFFAAHGYAVVLVNPRGSSGYGQAFSQALFADWGNKDYEDVMAGVDHAIAMGVADPERLGVGGWSYGGILTNYVITKTDRFKAAITGASEVLFVANYGHDHYQRQWEQELGLPWENRELWERLSPFNYVTNITTPTLIMGGALDWNVPILNSEQLYQALRRIGKAPTQLVVYPGEHHGIRTPSYQKDRYERYLAWYDRYVRGEAPRAAAGGAR